MDTYKFHHVTETIISFGGTDEDFSALLEIQKIAASIYDATAKVLNTGLIPSPVEVSERWIKRSQLKTIKKIARGLGIIVELNKIFPRILWKKNFEADIRVWTEGSQADLDAMKVHLKSLGIDLRVAPMKSKTGEANHFAGFLENPDLMKLRAINFPGKAEGVTVTIPPSVGAIAPAAPAAPMGTAVEKKDP